MTVDQGPVVTEALCEMCDQMAPLEEVDVIHGVVAHADCLPSHWIESRDETLTMMARLA